MAVADELERLAGMHARGELSDQEYEQAKARHLGKGRSGVAMLAGILVGGFLLLIGGTFVVGVLAAIAIPNFVQMQLRAKRAEVPSNVDGIRIAELAYQAAFDRFIPVGQPWPRAVASLDEAMVAMPEGSPFDELGWSPDGLLRGTYWVDVTPDGFTVHGMCDVDRDGEPASYEADAERPAHMVSGSHVY